MSRDARVVWGTGRESKETDRNRPAKVRHFVFVVAFDFGTTGLEFVWRLVFEMADQRV